MNEQDIRAEIHYWKGFRDAIEASKLNPDKIGALSGPVEDKIAEYKRLLELMGASP